MKKLFLYLLLCLFIFPVQVFSEDVTIICPDPAVVFYQPICDEKGNILDTFESNPCRVDDISNCYLAKIANSEPKEEIDSKLEKQKIKIKKLRTRLKKIKNR